MFLVNNLGAVWKLKSDVQNLTIQKSRQQSYSHLLGSKPVEYNRTLQANFASTVVHIAEWKLCGTELQLHGSTLHC